MKKNDGARKGLYIGAGMGLALFAIMGLLPGSFIGGVVGLNVAGKIMGLPLDTSVLPRVIIAVFMGMGVMVSAIVFTVGLSMAGWAVGHMIDALKYRPQQNIAVVVKEE